MQPFSTPWKHQKQQARMGENTDQNNSEDGRFYAVNSMLIFYFYKMIENKHLYTSSLNSCYQALAECFV